MKEVAKFVRAFFATLMLVLMQVVLFAQDTSGSNRSSGTTHTPADTTEWYTSPWIWVAAGAVLLVILIALLRSKSNNTVNGSPDQVTASKRRETDV